MIRTECEKCGAVFDNRGDVRRKYCDVCRKNRHGKRDMETAARLADYNLTIIGYDGEGQTGPCMNKDCSCTQYQPAGSGEDSPCVCGHRKVPFRIPGDKFSYRNGHNHKYVRAQCGKYELENLDGITIDEWLSWMYFDVAPNYPRDAAYVVYSGGYDKIMLWRTLPENRVARMLLNEQRTARKNLPVEYPFENPQWDLEAVNNTFRFRPHDPDKRHKVNSKDVGWIHLCDVFPFWQSSFLKAVDPSKYPPESAPCSREDYEKIRIGKERRDVAVLDDEMREYNRLEIETLERLVSGFVRELARIGVRLKRHELYGPGAVAAKTLSNWKIPRWNELPEIVPAAAFAAWEDSYVAGWFETFAHGNVKGSVYEYDINSAYPYVISRLPCLRHGNWDYANNYSSQNYQNLPELAPGSVRLIYAAVHGSNKYAGAMLHRLAFGAHQIIRPHNTEGWYVQEELAAAQRAGLIDSIEYKEWWTYVPCKCAPPLGQVKGMYERRRSLPDIVTDNGKVILGKDTPEGKALKLGPNSIYGKFAQKIGSHPYLNWIYASLITSGCRTMILNAIATHPDKMNSVVKIATDAVYFLTPHPELEKNVNDELGGWDRVIHENPTFFMSGIDWDEEVTRMGSGIMKSRGVNRKEAVKVAPEIAREFDEIDLTNPSQRWPVMKVRKPFEIYSPVQLMRWGRYRYGEEFGYSLWNLAGVVFESVETISCNPTPKRRTCSMCKTPYTHINHECDRGGVYRESGLWRSSVFDAGHYTDEKPGSCYSYRNVKSMREDLNERPAAIGLDTEGDIWTSLLEELKDAA